MAQDPLSLLCVEPFFPGKLGAIADWLVRRRGYRIHFFCHQVDAQEMWPESVGRGLDVITYNVGGVAKEPSVHWSRGLERGLCYAYGAWEVFDHRRLRPIDVVLGRSGGLGSTLFASVSYPGIPRINIFDYYYRPHLYDVTEDRAGDLPPEYFLWRRSANAMDLLDLENEVTPVAPTLWQRNLYPPEYQDDFTVLYEGVDARKFVRASERPREWMGRALPPETKVLTFVASSPDYLRGFERFVELANRLMRARRDVVFALVGGGPVSRMLDIHFHGQDYVKHCLEQNPLHDPSRFWNLGACSPKVVSDLLSFSDLHVYPSRPYPVAKSAVEAMSAGSVVLAWDSEPVREFVEHEKTGLIVPGNDMDAAEALAVSMIDDAGARRRIGLAAAAVVRERFSHDACLPKFAMLCDRLAASSKT